MNESAGVSESRREHAPTRENEPALLVEGLSFSVGGVPILRDISVRIGAGERWSIVGPNGAGKSTLLQCLMRIHTRWTGAVHLAGRPLAAYSQRALARRVAYVPQPGGEQRLPFTVRDFVAMGRYPYAGAFGTAHASDQAAIDGALERTGTTPLAARIIDSLSGGERQKVFIAAALAQGADILLLDEPTAFLDYRHQAEVATLLHALNEDCGATVVSVTHDVNAARLSGGRVLALRAGAVAWQGGAAGLMDATRLEAIFGASFRFLEDPATGVRLVAPQESL